MASLQSAGAPGSVPPLLDPSKLSIGRVLGRGAFATVYLATYEGIGPAALKVAVPASKRLPPVFERLFMNEVSLLCRHRHR